MQIGQAKGAQKRAEVHMELIEIEQRLAALEKELGELKRIIGSTTENGNWVEKISGSMVGNPAFPEAMRMAGEIRRADRPTDN